MFQDLGMGPKGPTYDPEERHLRKTYPDLASSPA